MDSDPYSVDPPPPPGPAPTPQKDLSGEDVLCVQCSYNVRGLPDDARCPECGTSVERSRQGSLSNLLKFSSDDYLASLQRGVTLILIAIAARFVATIVGAIGAAALVAILGSTNTNVDPDAVIQAIMVVVALVDLAIESVLIWGWWLFSAPDPAVLGADTGDRPRRIIRVTVIISAACFLIESMVSTLGVGPGATVAGVDVLLGGAQLLMLVAFAVKFFAAMRYLRWIAPRLPDPRVEERARLLTWLGPTLIVVGVLCAMIPWLVVLVLYVILLNWVRVDIKAIREDPRRVEWA